MVAQLGERQTRTWFSLEQMTGGKPGQAAGRAARGALRRTQGDGGSGGRRLAALAVAGMLAAGANALAAGAANALTLDEATTQTELKQVLNSNTVTLMSGCCTSGAYTHMAADIMDVVRLARDKNGLRVVPMLGGGAGTNVRDVMFLRGVDMAIVNMDTMSAYQKKPLYKDMKKRLRYVTKMFNEEVHLFARPGIRSIRALSGKRVGYTDSSAAITGGIIFSKLGVKPSKTMLLTEGDGAAMMREGRLDAMMRVSGKPIGGIQRLQQIFPGVRLLPIAYGPEFIGSHLPTQLSHADYPGLIPEGESVPTIATPTLLAVFNWNEHSDRYRRLARFVDVFFSHFSRLRSSLNRHPKWDEVNLQAKVPGLKRFKPAEQWLDQRFKVARKPDMAAKANLMRNFKKFLNSTESAGLSSGKPGDSEKLFREFIRWQKKKRQ